MKLLLQFVFLISISCFAQGKKEFVIHYKSTVPTDHISNKIRQIEHIDEWRILSSQKGHPLFNIVKIRSNQFNPKSITNRADIDYIEELPQTFLAEDTIPSDPYFPFQWEIDFMNTLPVWQQLNPNDTTLLVAIVDSGSDFDNPDLKRFYINTNDPINGLDDDGNSFIDDANGWDFGDYDNDPSVTIPYSNATNHGLRMTSLVASNTNNSIGLSSIGYNVKYITAKITQNDGQVVDPYEGVTYAIDQGAKVINCSWYQNTSTTYSKKVVNYAMEKGVLLVAAAGNDNSSSPVYPASDPTVLSVGALKENITKTSSSNFGSWVDIYSPGSEIYAARENNTYFKTSGTSVACAITSSACCLLKKRFPQETPSQLIERIKRSGTPFTDQNINGRYINLEKATQDKEYSNLIVFPNPVIDGQFSIQLPAETEKGLFTLQYFNMIGQKVFEENISVSENQNRITSQADLPAGQYIFKIKSKNVSKTSILTFAR